ncbi:hypothetical protein [Nonomuraea jabiensis]|uniref:CU044_5270 family protein n=1 Tax=Nonomuraea jabiensis TaxID=882448 RepID=A0A7W9LIV2_9ACTN|nr:hypothetical protein [Nonomuraea jabiensis]MBB5785353.1 hypothetical protein [Nonomuraea jabiensis]
MKRATAPARPLIALGAGLAAVGTAALLGLPNLAKAPEARLTAAASAPPEGAYWHTRVLTKHPEHRQLGSGANLYTVVQQSLVEEWTAPDGRRWVGSRELGAYPQSAADRAAWRRDGSPTKWTRTANGQTVSLSTKPAKGHVTPVRGDNTFFLLGQRLTYDEVQRLPANPEALKAWLTQAARVSQMSEASVDRNITSALPSLLHELPAPKEVRAAAYQALLTMPGVTSRGKSVDGAGRTGAALSIEYQLPGQKETIKVTTDLVVDTGTMLLLSDSQTTLRNGKVFLNKTMSQTVLQAGWTNTEPVVPALP